MKNNIFFTYYLDKGTIEESVIKDLLYIVPYSQFIKKYNINNIILTNLVYPDEKEDYILVDWYKNINNSRIIPYKKHSLRNIMTNSYNTIQLITFSKKTKIKEIIDEIFPYFTERGDSIREAKDKVISFIIETIKEYEK